MIKQRRETLMSMCADESVLILFSSKAKYRSADETYPFSVNRNFYYYTNLDREDMILMMVKHLGELKVMLFIQPYDEMLARWVSGRMSKEEAQAISKVDQVLTLDEFYPTLDRLYLRQRSYPETVFYCDAYRYQHSQEDSEGIAMMKYLKKQYPSVCVRDCFHMITKMRMIKDESEVEAIVEANRITTEGIVEMMKNISDGKLEMEIEAYFMLGLMRNGCHATAFPTIAAAGENATVLHYATNHSVCHEGDLFLCDLGATHRYYCADVSRTFPVSGKFSSRQKELMECVLEAQRIVETHAQPGISLRELNALVIEHYKKELPKLNLMKPVSEYYFHGVSHHLGLDTHDVTLDNTVLEPGMVITNEPGLYIVDENIGIRIEDDLLITVEGCRNLTTAPKTVSEIENVMKK